MLPAKKKATEAAANGKVTVKGKGKSKADPPPKASIKAVEPVEEEFETIEEFEAEPQSKTAAREPSNASKAKKAAPNTNTAAAAKTTKTSDKDIARLRQRCEEVRDIPCLNVWLDV